MTRALHIAKWAIAVILAASTAAALNESYRAQLDWASGHSLTQYYAWIWPLQIDVFIAVGELALFIAIALMWPVWVRVFCGAVIAVGLAASTAANVGHVTGHHDLITNRLTAAVPPLAAAVSLVVGMVILHFVATLETKRDYTPRHAAELAALPSDARRIIYAAEITASREPRELVAWLHDNGHAVSPENVRTVLRRQLALSNGHQEVPE